MKKTEKTSARVAKVAARLVNLTTGELLDMRLTELDRICKDIRLVAASALTQAPDRKR